MDPLQQLLQQKQEELQILVEKLKQATVHIPDGRLRISHCKKVPQYYHCKDNGKKKDRHYIQNKNRKLAYELAQKDYDLQMLMEAEKHLKGIRRLVKTYQPDELVRIYEMLNAERKKLITPRVISDDEYAKIWKEKTYAGKGFEEGSVDIFAEHGERVRSKSEKIIADMIFKRGIPYKYECPLKLSGMGIVYPDFTILNQKLRKEVYLEHLGMMDNTEYCEKALYKIDIYNKNGILLGDRLFITYETSRRPLNTGMVDKILKAFT